MKIVQVYLVESKRLYMKNCLEEGYEPEQEVLDRFDELIYQEGKLIRESDKDVIN